MGKKRKSEISKTQTKKFMDLAQTKGFKVTENINKLTKEELIVYKYLINNNINPFPESKTYMNITPDEVEINKDLYLKKKPFISETGRKDYSYCDKVFKLSLVDNNLYLEMQDTFLNNEVFPITLEELDENYISVLEFLNNAEYIGRESYREVPIYYSSKTPDYSFVADEFHPFGAKSNLDNKEECSHDETISEDKKRKFVILYKGETHLICYHNTGHGNFLSTPRSRLCIFDQRHVDDKWKFIGEELGMYKDYDDVITELSTDLPVEVKTKQNSK